MPRIDQRLWSLKTRGEYSFKRLAPLAYRANGKPIWKGGLSGKGGNFVERSWPKRRPRVIEISRRYTDVAHLYRDAAQALERLLGKGL